MTKRDPYKLLADIKSQIDLYHHDYPAEFCEITAVRAQLERDGHAILDRTNMHGHITGSMFVLSPDNKQFALINHLTINRWFQPGGHCEPDESPEESALREAQEELGISEITMIGRLLDIDTHAIDAVSSKHAAHRHHDFMYLGRATHRVFNPQLTEVSTARWVDLSTDLPDRRLNRAVRKVITKFEEMRRLGEFTINKFSNKEVICEKLHIEN